MKYKAIEDIDTIKELRKQKKKIQKKISRKEAILSEKFNFFDSDDAQDNLLAGILERIGIKNSALTTLIPILFQYKNEIIQSKILIHTWNFLRKKPYLSLSFIGITIGYILYNKAADYLNQENEPEYTDAKANFTAKTQSAKYEQETQGYDFAI